jgi:hypothetical protein
MSFDASGTVAGAIVFAKWRGRNYVRRHAVPANPRSGAQLAARAVLGFCGSQWASLDPGDQATWEAAAESEKISAFNQFIKVNARNWRDQMAPSMASPAARAQTPGSCDSVNPTVSGRQVLLEFANTPGADDWGLVVCRSLILGAAGVPSNAIVIVAGVAATNDVVDGPLAPGAYYYNGFLITEDGVLSSPCTEQVANVT